MIKQEIGSRSQQRNSTDNNKHSIMLMNQYSPCHSLIFKCGANRAIAMFQNAPNTLDCFKLQTMDVAFKTIVVFTSWGHYHTIQRQCSLKSISHTLVSQDISIIGSNNKSINETNNKISKLINQKYEWDTQTQIILKTHHQYLSKHTKIY